MAAYCCWVVCLLHFNAVCKQPHSTECPHGCPCCWVVYSWLPRAAGCCWVVYLWLLSAAELFTHGFPMLLSCLLITAQCCWVVYSWFPTATELFTHGWRMPLNCLLLAVQCCWIVYSWLPNAAELSTLGCPMMLSCLLLFPVHLLMLLCHANYGLPFVQLPSGSIFCSILSFFKCCKVQ